MSTLNRLRNAVATSLLCAVAFTPLGAWATMDSAQLDQLFVRLAEASDAAAARTIADEIEFELSRSGSPSMDLLMRRGKRALEQNALNEAYEHFSALTDHAPEFSEGWYWRARTLALMDRPGQAIADLERVLTLEPRHYAALVQLAALLEELDMSDLATRAYAEAESVHPHLDGVDEALTRLRRSATGTEL